MDKKDVARAYHECRDARMKLENMLAAAPADVRMEYRTKYRQENPDRGFFISTTSGRTNAKRRRPATRTQKLDAIRQQAAACNVRAMMIRRGMQTWR